MMRLYAPVRTSPVLGSSMIGRLANPTKCNTCAGAK